MALAIIGIQVKVGGVQEAVREFRELKTAVDGLVKSVKRLEGIKAPRLQLIQQLGDQNIVDMRQWNKTIDQSERTTIRFGAATSNTRRQVDGFTRAVQGLGRSLRAVHLGFGGLAGQVTNFGRRLVSFGSIITTLGFRLGVLTAPFVLGLGSAIKSAVSFEDEMIGLITRVRIGTEAMQQMREGIINISREFGQAPVDLAAASYAILSREVRDTGTALQLLEGSAKAAAIGLGDVRDISAFAASVFVTMGDSMSSVTEIFDVLIRAVQFGAIEADELTDAMGRALGLAVNLGIPLRELTSFVGTFSIATDSASEAVTGLIGIFRAVLKPTKAAKEAFARIFGTGGDIEAGAKAALQAIEELGLARFIRGVSEAAKELDIPLSSIFGRIQGLNAALFVSQAAWEEYQRVLDATNNSAGALDEAFTIVQASTGFQLQLLRANLQVLGITIGETLLPAINTVVQAILPWIEGLRQLVKLHPQLGLIAAGFVLIAAVVGPVVVIFGIFLSSIGTIFSALGGLLGIIVSLINPLNLLSAAVVAIAALFGAAFLFQIPNAVREGIDSVQYNVRSTWDGLDEDFNNFADRAWAWGRNIVVSLAQGLADGAVFVLNVIRDIGASIAKLLSPGSPPELLPELYDWGENIIDSLLHGMTLADFSVFDDLAATMGKFFQSLPELADVDAINLTLASRTAIAEAIKEFRDTGSIAQSTIDRITGSFGHITSDLQEYIRLMFEAANATAAVAEAQEEVDRINKEFEESIKPLNKRIGEIADRFEEVKRQQEIEGLQDILADPRAPELAKELALLQLERLELEAQVGEQEDIRDAQLEVAEARLEAAKAAEEEALRLLEIQQNIIDVQIENNSLMKSLETAIESAKKAAEGLGSALAGGAFAGFSECEGEDCPESIFESIGASLTEMSERIKGELKLLADDLKDIFAPVVKAWGEMREEWEKLFALMDENDITLWDIGAALLGIWIALQLIKLVGIGPVLKGIWTVFGLIAGILGFGPGAGTVVGGFSALLAILTGPIGVTAALAALLLVKVDEEFPTWTEKVEAFNLAIWAMNGILLTLQETLVEKTIPALVDFFSVEVPDWIQGKLEEYVDGLTEAVNDLKDAIVSFIQSIPGLISSIPSLIIGNSPSPLEESLMGIAAAFGIVNEEMSTFSENANRVNGMNVSASFASTSGVNAVLPVEVAAMGGQSSATNFNIGPNSINNGMDQAIFEARVRQIVAQAVR